MDVGFTQGHAGLRVEGLELWVSNSEFRASKLRLSIWSLGFRFRVREFHLQAHAWCQGPLSRSLSALAMRLYLRLLRSWSEA